MENHGSVEGGAVVAQKPVGLARKKTLLPLRVLGLALTMVAAIIMGTDTENKIVPMKIVDSLPPVNIPAQAKWNYISAFVFFFASNVIASVYGALSLFLSVSGRNGVLPIIFILDIVMAALLFSSTGAATAIGVLGLEGNSHVRWNKACDVFGKFCKQAITAISFSFVGSLVFLLLVLLTALRLSQRPSK